MSLVKDADITEHACIIDASPEWAFIQRRKISSWGRADADHSLCHSCNRQLHSDPVTPSRWRARWLVITSSKQFMLTVSRAAVINITPTSISHSVSYACSSLIMLIDRCSWSSTESSSKQMMTMIQKWMTTLTSSPQITTVSCIINYSPWSNNKLAILLTQTAWYPWSFCTCSHLSLTSII